MIFHRSVSLPEGSGLPMFGGMAVDETMAAMGCTAWSPCQWFGVCSTGGCSRTNNNWEAEKNGNYPISRQTHLDHVVQCHVADAFKLGQSRFGKLRSFALTGRDFFHVRGWDDWALLHGCGWTKRIHHKMQLFIRISCPISRARFGDISPCSDTPKRSQKSTVVELYIHMITH